MNHLNLPITHIRSDVKISWNNCLKQRKFNAMYPFEDSEDVAHFFFAFPLIVYASLEYCLCFTTEIKIRPQMKRVGTGLFIFGLGLAIFVGEIVALSHCKSSNAPCIQRNRMHVLFGAVLLEKSALIVLYQSRLIRSVSVYYLDGLALIIVGIFMTMHIQPNPYGIFIHRAFGAVTISAGILYLIAVQHPEWQPFACVATIASGVTFIFGSHSTTKYFSNHLDDWGNPNVLFLIFTIVLGWVLILTFCLWKFAPPSCIAETKDKSKVRRHQR